jgi:hypothetical protein
MAASALRISSSPVSCPYAIAMPTVPET